MVSEGPNRSRLQNHYCFGSRARGGPVLGAAKSAAEEGGRVVETAIAAMGQIDMAMSKMRASTACGLPQLCAWRADRLSRAPAARRTDNISAFRSWLVEVRFERTSCCRARHYLPSSVQIFSGRRPSSFNLNERVFVLFARRSLDCRQGRGQGDEKMSTMSERRHRIRTSTCTDSIAFNSTFKGRAAN